MSGTFLYQILGYEEHTIKARSIDNNGQGSEEDTIALTIEERSGGAIMNFITEPFNFALLIVLIGTILFITMYTRKRKRYKPTVVIPIE